jgi:hypothetical protein
MSDALATIPIYRGTRGSYDENALTSRRSRAKPKRVVVAPVQPRIEISGRALAIIADYDDLWASIRAQVDALRITRLELDHLSGLQEGYSSTLLASAQAKKFGMVSLGSILGAIGCRLALVEDPEAAAKIIARAKKRRRAVRPTPQQA